MYFFRVSFLTNLDIYKSYFQEPSHTDTDTETKRLIFSVWSYCICTPHGIVTKCFPIFIVNEVKNFAANNIYSSARVSYLLGSVQRVSHKLEVCASKGKKATTRWSPIRYWSKGWIVGWYFGIGLGSWYDSLYL